MSLQFGRIQWDSLKNKNRWNIHIQTTPLNSQVRQRRGRRDWNISREAGAPKHFFAYPELLGGALRDDPKNGFVAD